jgi:hypothetical protein
MWTGIASLTILAGSMIFSDLPSPAEASSHATELSPGFAQAGNRHPLCGIMIEPPAGSGP